MTAPYYYIPNYGFLTNAVSTMHTEALFLVRLGMSSFPPSPELYADIGKYVNEVDRSLQCILKKNDLNS